MPSTYTPIASSTLTSTQASVTFSGISATYTDLVLVLSGLDSRGGGANDDSVQLTFNTDTSTSSTNYSWTSFYGNGSSAASGRGSNSRGIDAYVIGTPAQTTPGVIVSNIMNYSNTSMWKTVLCRGGTGYALTSFNIGLWRDTAAINSITIWPGYNGSGYNFLANSTFALYGIKAA